MLVLSRPAAATLHPRASFLLDNEKMSIWRAQRWVCPVAATPRRVGAHAACVCLRRFGWWFPVTTLNRRSAMLSSRMTKTSTIDMRSLAGNARDDPVRSDMTRSPSPTMRTTSSCEAQRSTPLDGLVVRLLAKWEGAEDGPRNVVGQAGQDVSDRSYGSRPGSSRRSACAVT
jgi:hypothetical protein